ncbi:HepT-like ribonuclease domain-containing protein [Meiothermus rufus]|uniref:HepT-like ribonuclease domain-containing protein n=1 Tax=Meiothermus rufus TaxID=604332 RepID=UPI000422026B|nr:DUF86 domain-containing protein [Meiothermus rufus]
MSRNVRLYLEDIRESCARIRRYTAGFDFERFVADEKTVDAVVRNLIVIGEAVKNLPLDFRQRHPAIEWRKIAGLRDIVVHEYFGIDEDVLWDVIQTRIPKLEKAIDAILAVEFGEDE